MSIAVCYRVREEMAGNCRQLHSIGLHYVLCGCHVKELGSYGGQQKYAEIFAGETCGPEIAVSLRLKWKHNIAIDLKEIE